MPVAETNLRSKRLSEKDVTCDLLESLKRGEELKPTIPQSPSKVGVTEYPILEFDDRALRLLHEGVSETLKYSKVKPSGSKFYEFIKRLFDIMAGLLGEL